MLLVYLATQQIFDVIVVNTKDLKKMANMNWNAFLSTCIHIDIFKHEIRYGIFRIKLFAFSLKISQKKC